MQHTLRVQLSDIEGSIIRALGLMERRGFRILKCNVHEAEGNRQAMEVKVLSDRPGDLLKRQLERLHDVLHVELSAAPPITPKSPGIRPIKSSLSDLT